MLIAPDIRAELRVTDLSDGEVLRYPVALLRGSTDDQGQIQVRNRSNHRPDGSNEAPIVDGKFVILVELVPGRNQLLLRTAANRLQLSVIYRPMTTSYRLKVIYVTAADGNTNYLTDRHNDPQNYQDKIDTAVKLMQTFTAERLNDIGLGRKTFNLEFDSKGKVIVHTMRYPADPALLRHKTGNELFSMFYDWLGKQFDMDRYKLLTIMGFTGYDPIQRQPLGHTALGGGSLGLFSANGMSAWPNNLRDVARAFSDATPVDDQKIWDDTAGRGTHWALASTTIGAILHEMGHTFGLPHSKDPESIMLRGFDHFNRVFTYIEPPSKLSAHPFSFQPNQAAYWDPTSAAHLVTLPWFEPDEPSIPNSHGK